MMKIYTKTGDKGSTSLVGGERVKKNCARIEAYGTLDELMSFIGAIASGNNCQQEVKGQLKAIQSKLFDIGTYLATPVKDASEEPKAAKLSEEDVTRVEGWLDALDEQTPKMNCFVLPGGCDLASRAHQARTVCRRAERCILTLSDESYVDPRVLEYINRLSDYLFVLARYFNFMADVDEIAYKY